MNPLRFLPHECIEIDLELADGSHPPPPEQDDGEADDVIPDDQEGDEAAASPISRSAWREFESRRDELLWEITLVLERSGRVVNPSKLHRDLVNRERKAPTVIIPGVAIPHVRSLQARAFVIGLIRLRGPGIPFAGPDGEPVRLFLPMVSPPYEDRLYLRAYQAFAGILADHERVAALEAATTTQDVHNILRTGIGN